MNQMSKSFNLVNENWIPVINLKGDYSKISLNEIFTNGISYADLAVRPHERVALMRLLLCISHAALDGPEDVEEWQKVPILLPVKSRSYLEKWEGSFDLFSVDKPFLQIPGLVKVPKSKKESGNEANSDEDDEDYTPISRLDFSLPSGNNPVLFEHSALSDKITVYHPADITIMLLTYQNFFLSGGNTSTMNWGGEVPDKKPTYPVDGPCSPSSMYHCFIRGENLLKTIQMNLITKNDLGMHFSSFSSDWWGYPVWEKFPMKRSDIEYINNATETFLGRMVPLAQLIRILPTCDYMCIGEGLSYRSFNSDNPYVPEITATIAINEKKQEYYLLGITRNKSQWRDLPAILIKRNANKGGVGGPLCLSNIEEDQCIDIHILALERNRASALQLIESVYSLPYVIFTDIGRSAYEIGVNTAELISYKLGRAIEKYRKSIDGGWEGRLKSAGALKMDLLERLHSSATIHYWTIVEESLKILMDYVESIGLSPESVINAKKRWESILFKAARESYMLICPNETPRQMRAFALGWQIINSENNSKNQDTESKEGDK